ncbi:MAG: hypothetical protein WCV84_05390 [Patescibacteria group bacterium]
MDKPLKPGDKFWELFYLYPNGVRTLISVTEYTVEPDGIRLRDGNHDLSFDRMLDQTCFTRMKMCMGSLGEEEWVNSDGSELTVDENQAKRLQRLLDFLEACRYRVIFRAISRPFPNMTVHTARSCENSGVGAQVPVAATFLALGDGHRLVLMSDAKGANHTIVVTNMGKRFELGVERDDELWTMDDKQAEYAVFKALCFRHLSTFVAEMNAKISAIEKSEAPNLDTFVPV